MSTSYDDDEEDGYFCSHCDETYDEVHAECPWCENACIEHESCTVVTAIDADGDVSETVEVCEDCRDNHTFFCVASEENYEHDSFTVVSSIHGDDICLEFVTSLGNRNDYIEVEAYDRVFAHVDDFDPEIHVRKEQKMYADFYWKMPSKKFEASKLPVGGRILVLMNDEGGEVSSETSSGVKELTRLIDERIKQAGADVSDQNVANTYARIVLIEKGFLPKDYRL